MLRRLDKMVGFNIEGTDGEMGKVHDFYFDDQEWMVRYLVVETGSWLTSKLVLLSPACVGAPVWQEERVPVDLTKEQVANSPDIDLHQPISRQQLESLDAHYRWPDYWAAGPRWVLAEGATVGMAPVRQDVEPAYDYKAQAGQRERPNDDLHLRSVSEVTGYHIEATDGDIGHVVDFFAEDATWRIEYMLVDTRNLLPGRHVIISPRWISEASWPEREVRINVTREKVKDSPRFDPLPDTFSQEYEHALHTHYGLPYPPPYWGERTSAEDRMR